MNEWIEVINFVVVIYLVFFLLVFVGLWYNNYIVFYIL